MSSNFEVEWKNGTDIGFRPTGSPPKRYAPRLAVKVRSVPEELREGCSTLQVDELDGPQAQGLERRLGA
jgi:hypothetical protein